ncbi:hypothetical protein ZWY2020_040178 [Hordeum vulgare]|nr:hypothetical protein ZWY2020_040178 [Hordeum vulgare]
MDACYLEELTTLLPRARRITFPLLSRRSMGRMPPMSEMKVVLLLTFSSPKEGCEDLPPPYLWTSSPHSAMPDHRVQHEVGLAEASPLRSSR